MWNSNSRSALHIDSKQTSEYPHRDDLNHEKAPQKARGKNLRTALIVALAIILASSAAMAQTSPPPPPVSSGYILNNKQPTAKQVQSVFASASSLQPQNPNTQGLSFLNVVNKLVAPTANPNTATPQAVAFVQSMLDSFKLKSAVNAASGVTEPLTPLPDFSGMSATAMLNSSDIVNGMAFEAAMDRNDAASADGTSCGEGRLIFALQGGRSDPTRRFFIIFEANEPPFPAPGPNGCYVYNSIWDTIGKETSSKNVMTDLNELFMTGIPTPIGLVPPLVNANNYGFNGNAGQVRVNDINPTDAIWRLRQYVVDSGTTAGTLVLKPEPVAQSPDPIYYANPVSGEPKAVTATRTAFWNTLTSKLPAVAQADLALADKQSQDQNQLFQSMMTASIIPVNVDAFESVSSSFFSPNEDPTFIMSPTLQGQLVTSLANLNKTLTASGSLAAPLSMSQVGSRLNMLRCGGCHQESSGQNEGTFAIGGLIQFPPITFVHVDENSNPSFLLNPSLFLARANLQTAYLATHTFPTTTKFPVTPTAETTAVETSASPQASTVDTFVQQVPGAQEILQDMQAQAPPQNAAQSAEQKRLAVRQAREQLGIGLGG